MARPIAASAERKHHRLAGSDPLRRQRTRARPPHEAVGLALVDLIEPRGAAGDQRDADDRFCEPRDIEPRSRTEVIPDAGGHDDEGIQAGFGEREEIGCPLGGCARLRSRVTLSIHGANDRTRRLFHAWAPERPRCEATGGRTRTATEACIAKPHAIGPQRQHERGGKRERADHDVCGVDGDVLFRPDDERAECHLGEHEHHHDSRGALELRSIRVVIPHVTRGRRDRQRDERRPDPVRVVNRYRSRPLRWEQPTEHQRKIRNRQSCVRMSHRRTHDDLEIDEDGRCRRDDPEEAIVDGVRVSARPIHAT